MARRHYGIDVEVIQIRDGNHYEDAFLDGSSEVIVEHLDYLYDEGAKGTKITMFCAPSRGGGLELVVQSGMESVSELKGKTMAVRSSGQPHAITLWLRMMGLDREVRTILVDDGEVGRWGQWKKVASGECAATFMSPLHLPHAVKAGLKVLDVPEIPIVGHFAQACLSRFAAEHPETFMGYVKAVIHALCLIVHRRDEALEIVSGEPMRRMKINDPAELKRQLDLIAMGLKTKPYPTSQAMANTYEIATVAHTAARGFNPMALWDLHWVKRLDDEGFIDGLIKNMSDRSL